MEDGFDINTVDTVKYVRIYNNNNVFIYIALTLKNITQKHIKTQQ